MAIVPTTFRIVVKPHDVQEEDDTFKRAKAVGIALLDNKREQEAVDKGTVVSFGPTAFQEYNTTNPLVVGDTIVYARHAGKKVADSGEDFLIINDADVVCIIKKEPKNG